jgi:hypothetical protein
MHYGRIINAALTAFKGNIYQKHIYTWNVLPHHYKNIYIDGGYIQKFVHVVLITPHVRKPAISNIFANSKQNQKGHGQYVSNLFRKADKIRTFSKMFIYFLVFL